MLRNGYEIGSSMATTAATKTAWTAVSPSWSTVVQGCQNENNRPRDRATIEKFSVTDED